MTAPAPHPPHAVGRAAALLPPALCAVSACAFGLALAAAPFVADELRDHFYQTRVMALVHTLTLGWITSAMLGVLYRYVPALTKRPLPFPRIATAQAALFVVAAGALVAGFWIGRWAVVAAAAAALVAAVALLLVNLWPLLAGAPRRGVAESGMLIATGFLLATAVLGTLFAVDKDHPILGGSLLGNLAAHVHLGAAGWVGLTIAALSFRFLPAFLLPTVQMPRTAHALVWLLAAAVLALAAALLARSGLVPALAAVVAAALLGYLAVLGRIVASHRMPIDWTTRHALTGSAWLLLGCVAGVTLAVTGAESALGARLAVAYGVAAILGWMSNLLMGMSYKLFPGFVAAARVERRRRAVPIAALGVPATTPPVVFATYNAGVALVAGALLADDASFLRAGLLALLAGGGVWVAATLRTLGFVLRDPAPTAPRTSATVT